MIVFEPEQGATADAAVRPKFDAVTISAQAEANVVKHAAFAQNNAVVIADDIPFDVDQRGALSLQLIIP
jgi:hypothetical protein